MSVKNNNHKKLRVLGIILFSILAGYSFYLCSIITPSKYILLYIGLNMVFAGIWALTMRFVKKRYKDYHYKGYIPISKIVNSAFWIMWIILFIWFGGYIFPRPEEYFKR